MICKKYILFLLIPFFLLYAQKGFCEDAQEKKTKTYSSSTSFSALLTAGNSKDITISMDTDQNLNFDKDQLNWKAWVIYSRSNSKKVSEVYSSSLKYSHRLNGKTSLLVLASFSRNVLSGYNSRIGLSTGIGHLWVQNPKLHLNSEIAFGWSSENNAEKLADQIIGSPDTLKKITKASFMSSIITTRLDFNISSSAQLSQQVDLFMELRDLAAYRLNSYSALSAAINTHFALKTSLQFIYENRPVPGYKHTDVYILSSIVFTL